MRIIDADDAIKKYAHYGIDHVWDATDLEEILNEMPTIKTKEVKYYDEDDSVWKIGRVIVDE